MKPSIAGYKFKDANLLEKALTHASFANEHPGAEANERLEFLGDSVLGLLCAEYVYEGNKQVSEGELTKMRSQIVCNENLAAFASRIGIGNYLRLGQGEKINDGKRKHAILANAIEATIGALYLDGGIEAARCFIGAYIAECANKISSYGLVINTDYKSRLQQISQQMSCGIPEYELLDDQGPDHQKLFTKQVSVAGHSARGTGKSKKEADQAAAKNWLSRFTHIEHLF